MQTILLVDDEPTMLRLCQDILGLGGYQVLPFGSAEEALRVLQNGTAVIDLLLSDVVMPGMNGIELANHVRSKHPNTKAVLMSGYGPRDIEKVAGG